MDTIRTLADLATAFGQARAASGKRATEIASHAGRSRAILYRLEQGEDITVSALLDLIRGTGYALQLVPAGMPTLEEMRRRFAQDVDEDEEPS